MGKYKKSYNRLFELASSQQGFFTAKQAIGAGYANNVHPFHVKSGNWIREMRGIYRLSNYPPAERPDLVIWSLWSCGYKDKPQGIFSHQTALSIYDLSDMNPAKLHMTVPPGFRRFNAIPKALILYKYSVPESDIEDMQGFRVTRPLRTIVDLIAEETVSEDFIEQAVKESLDRGLIQRSKVEGVKRFPAGVVEKLQKIVERAGS